MADETELLREITTDPGNDGPRLVYASFIERNGAADRADFIRVQCRLAQLPIDHPQRAQLELREKELLQRYGRTWTEEFQSHIHEWVYRRGFIECADMHLEVPADQIINILQRTPIRYMRASGQFCNLAGVVGALPYMGQLLGLEFWDLYAVDDALMARILHSEYLANLRSLILHHDRNGNLIDDDVLVEAMSLPNRANLAELGVNIDGTWRGPSRRVLKAMADSPHLRNLRRLYLSNAGDTGNCARMDVETARCLGRSANFVRMEELDLGQTSFTEEVWDEVIRWPWLSQLKWIRLHYARQVKPPHYYVTVSEIQKIQKYREAFEGSVGEVDWEMEYVSPWTGGPWWRGMTRSTGK